MAPTRILGELLVRNCRLLTQDSANEAVARCKSRATPGLLLTLNNTAIVSPPPGKAAHAGTGGNVEPRHVAQQ